MTSREFFDEQPDDIHKHTDSIPDERPNYQSIMETLLSEEGQAASKAELEEILDDVNQGKELVVLTQSTIDRDIRIKFTWIAAEINGIAPALMVDRLIERYVEAWEQMHGEIKFEYEDDDGEASGEDGNG